MSVPTNTTQDTYRATFEVRWDDADLNGHLRSTRYLDYAATTRLKALDSVGWGIPTLMRGGLTTVLLGEQVDYLREVYLGQSVVVSCEVVGETPDGSRWKCRHVVAHEGGQHAAVIDSLGAWFDLASRRIVTPPKALLAALQPIRSSSWSPLEPSRSPLRT